MQIKYKNMEELRKKQEALEAELKKKEDILTFKDTKKSFSLFTNGFTDKFLSEKQIVRKDEEGNLTTEKKLRFNPSGLLTSNNVKKGAQLGISTAVGNFAKKNLHSSNWKKKAIGLAMVYVLPILLRKGIEYLEEHTDD